MKSLCVGPHKVRFYYEQYPLKEWRPKDSSSTPLTVLELSDQIHVAWEQAGAPHIRGAAVAYILDPDEEHPLPVHMGVALCSHKDNFCRSKGRKVAFAHLLNTMNLSKEERQHAWFEYHSHFPF